MKNKMEKFMKTGYYGLLLFGVLVPFRFVLGAGASGSYEGGHFSGTGVSGTYNTGGIEIGSTGGGIGIGTKGSSPVTAKINNPIKVDSIQGLIKSILEIVVAVGTPIAVLFLMFAGFKFVTAQGDPGKVKEAKEMLTWVIVGIVVLLGASVLSTVIKGTIDQLKVGL